jgi:putative acetyltransferase
VIDVREEQPDDIAAIREVNRLAFGRDQEAGIGAALGPMAVLPAHQRQGIGRTLVETGTRKLQTAGCPFIVVVGHAAYYSRFGFTPARAHGIISEWDLPDDVFMVLVLDPARVPRGRARYRREFSTVT